MLIIELRNDITIANIHEVCSKQKTKKKWSFENEAKKKTEKKKKKNKFLGGKKKIFPKLCFFGPYTQWNHKETKQNH